MAIADESTARLGRSFYTRDATTVARALIGQRLVRIDADGNRLAGTIVETEAYLGIPDLAAHTARGRRTSRNESMWRIGGTLYVYFTYGMHHCMNVVAHVANEPVAALIRAIEPTEGIEQMRINRSHRSKRKAGPIALSNLCSGPAKLCQAFDIDRSNDGIDLVTSDRLFIEQLRQRAMPESKITATTRVGIDYAGDWRDKPLRFYLRGNPHVSKP